MGGWNITTLWDLDCVKSNVSERWRLRPSVVCWHWLQGRAVLTKGSKCSKFFQDGALARLYRASMSLLSLDSRSNWKDHWLGLEGVTKGQQFRLDLPLKGKEPDIDDVDEMPGLQHQVRHQLGDLKGLARAVKAVSFFFRTWRTFSAWRCWLQMLRIHPISQSK